MSDRLLRLSEGLLRLEDSLLRLVDRLVDNPIIEYLPAFILLIYNELCRNWEIWQIFSRTVLLYETMSIDGVGALSAAMMRPAKYRLRRGR